MAKFNFCVTIDVVGDLWFNAENQESSSVSENILVLYLVVLLVDNCVSQSLNLVCLYLTKYLKYMCSNSCGVKIFGHGIIYYFIKIEHINIEKLIMYLLS